MSELKPMTVKQLVLRITDLIKRGKIIPTNSIGDRCFIHCYCDHGRTVAL